MPYFEPDHPCSCGSRKTHRDCCMLPEEKARYELDHQVLAGLLTWAYDASDPTHPPVEPVPPKLVRGSPELGFYLRWRFYTYLPVGVSLLESYLVARHETLSYAESAWLGAQAAAWLSIWEATEVQPGVGARMRDLLTGEERFVFESVGSAQLRVGSTVLARVILFSQKACFCGIHPRPVAVGNLGLLLETVRRKLARGRRVPADGRLPIPWMQEEGIAQGLVEIWESAIAVMLTVQPRKKTQN